MLPNLDYKKDHKNTQKICFTGISRVALEDGAISVWSNAGRRIPYRWDCRKLGWALVAEYMPREICLNSKIGFGDWDVLEMFFGVEWFFSFPGRGLSREKKVLFELQKNHRECLIEGLELLSLQCSRLSRKEQSEFLSEEFIRCYVELRIQYSSLVQPRFKIRIWIYEVACSSLHHWIF